jgi:SAM-dependent methyltransferase
MIDQRPPSAAPVVCAAAERLPFADNTFDVALSVLSVHHWNSASSGLAEMRRVAQNQVIVTWDPIVFAREFWLVRDYLPEVIEHESRLATLAGVAGHLGKHEVKALPVSADCADGVFGAYWRRPHAYLDPAIRAAISGLALLDPELVRDAMERLRSDLESGCWYHRYSELTEMNEVDLGYRLVIAEE